MQGVINVLKPPGLTSSDVVVRVRRILKEHYKEKLKVGHMGTLDPLGAGVLVVAVGNAARLFDYFLGEKKEYITTVRWGRETDTLDSEGTAVCESDKVPCDSEVESVLAKFIGEIEQIPPAYSRVSLNGARLCSLARNGSLNAADIPVRRVCIYGIKVTGNIAGHTQLTVSCSGGTYIRSLVRDIAHELGTCAYASSIIRTVSGRSRIEDSLTLQEIGDNPAAAIRNCADYLSMADPIYIGGETGRRALNGIMPQVAPFDGENLLYIDGKLFGIIKQKEGEAECVIRLWE